MFATKFLHVKTSSGKVVVSQFSIYRSIGIGAKRNPSTWNLVSKWPAPHFRLRRAVSVP